MADPDAQPPERIAHLVNHVPHSVVTARTAALLETDDAGWKIELVVGDQYRLDRHLVERGHTLRRASAPVHEAHGLEQPDFLTGNARPRELGLMARLIAERRAMTA